MEVQRAIKIALFEAFVSVLPEQFETSG